MKYYYLVLLLLIMPLVSAESRSINESNRNYVESRIYSTNDSYIINWSEDGNEYRDSEAWRTGIRKVYNSTFSLLEIDPHYAQIIKVKEVDESGQFTTIELTVVENPDNPYHSDRVPLRACVNSTKIFNARRFEEPNTWCPEPMTQYYVGNIQFGNTYTVRFEEHPSPYVWWLGEDDYDGTFGQGGIGDGVVLCEGLVAGLSLQDNSLILNGGFNDTNGTMTAGFTGSTSAGCTVSRITLQFLDNVGTWRAIPVSNDSQAVNCMFFNSCNFVISNFGSYKREFRCDIVQNVSLRTRLAGTVSGISRVVYSPARNLECLPEVIIEEETEDDGVWLLWLFFPASIYFYVLLLYKKKKLMGDKK